MQKIRLVYHAQSSPTLSTVLTNTNQYLYLSVSLKFRLMFHSDRSEDEINCAVKVFNSTEYQDMRCVITRVPNISK